MGNGSYSCVARAVRSENKGYKTAKVEEIFTSKSINNAMNPHGVGIRESRDSVAHPNSVAIILGLDVTGSMGSVPHYLVKQGLPLFMDKIIKGGVSDPQVLFAGIGDHECDKSPLQISQFESSDELLDKWLTDLYLEGGGGGNYGESYLLAWYFALKHTSIDCWEKRKQKGFLITVGDEPTLKDVPASVLKKLFGDGQYSDCSSAELITEVSKNYNVYHLNIAETSSGSRSEVRDGWTQLLHDNFINVKRKEDVAEIIAGLVVENSVKETQSVGVGSGVDSTEEEEVL